MICFVVLTGLFAVLARKPQETSRQKRTLVVETPWATRPWGRFWRAALALRSLVAARDGSMPPPGSGFRA